MGNEVYNNVLKLYDMLGVEDVIPIAHIRIKPDIGILLDDSGNFLAATLTGEERSTIPCTIDSESRTSGVSPHPIHDNMSYICVEYPKFRERHIAYMNQLGNYVSQVDDILAKSVYTYLTKRTIRKDIAALLEYLANTQEEKIMVVFATLSHTETISKKWTQYYLSKLKINGICGITGEPDHIPSKYPKGIRNPADQARLFISNQKKMDSMPLVAPGYIASQKIIHTLQFMIYEGDSWAYQILKNKEKLPKEYKKWVREYERKKA